MRLKTYLVTLLIFLIFLYGGILFILTFSLKNNINNIKERALGEHYFIMSSYYNDLKHVEYRKNSETNNKTNEDMDNEEKLLFDLYFICYQKQPVYLGLLKNNVILKSTLPNINGDFYTNLDTNLDTNKRKIFYNRKNNKDYLFILGNLPEPFNYLTIVYCYDLSTEIENWIDMCKLFFSFSLTLSVFLGIILYIVIYYIFKPLTEITVAAEKIAKGDYSNISVKGKGEIKKVAVSFNYMADEIKKNINKYIEIAKQKQDFIDNLAHELRTPLTNIYGYAEYIQKAKLTEKDKFESTDVIMSESERLQNISQRLLNLAMYREQNIKFNNIKLADIIKKVLTSFKIKLNEKNIQIKFESENFNIKGDEVLIECLFSNIVDNAIKACNKNGKIIIKSFKDNNEYTNVTIYDNGKEIPKDAINHLTEAFYRVDKNRSRDDGGAGIGLTLCKEIILKHNAMINFSSDSAGTKVKITFTK